MSIITATETKATEGEIAYSVNVIDSESPASWMGLSCVRRLTPGAQDSGRCRWTVIIDADGESDFLDALVEDDDVVDFDEVV